MKKELEKRKEEELERLRKEVAMLKDANLEANEALALLSLGGEEDDSPPIPSEQTEQEKELQDLMDAISKQNQLISDLENGL